MHDEYVVDKALKGLAKSAQGVLISEHHQGPLKD
jgi:hypothetical protein